MEHVSKYVAKKPDENGYIQYTAEEDGVWHTLIERQIKIATNRACDEFIRGLDVLNMPHDRVPQCLEMNDALGKATGWSVEPVAAMIPVDYFFTLLANRKFPAASFIRIPEELDYLEEPDIFHEFFGHCPILTDQTYANFMAKYGEIALRANEQQREYLARLYWFTVEFGLMKTPSGFKNYGGGILSSKGETIFAVESDEPERRPLGNCIDALRTPYRTDIMQTIYYYIENFSELYRLVDDEQGLLAAVDEAHHLGEFEPTFPLTEKELMILRC